MSSEADVHTSCSPLNCDNTIGAALIGFAIALCLYGITTGQALLYFGRYGRGRGRSWFWTQCHVTIIWTLDTMHTIFLTQTMFYYCIAQHGRPTQFTTITWSFSAIVISAEISNAVVRIGYAHKTWKFSNRKAPIPVAILSVTIVLLALGFWYGVEDMQIRTFQEAASFEWSFYLAFAANVTVDTLIAASVLLLFRGFLTGIKRFDVILRIVILCVVGSGLVSAVLTTLSLMLYLLWPRTFLDMACYWILAKLHACSFLAVVHAEKELAERASSHSQHGLPLLTTALRMDDRLTAFPEGTGMMKSNSLSETPPTTEHPMFSDSTEIAEVQRRRKSKESEIMSLRSAA